MGIRPRREKRIQNVFFHIVRSIVETGPAPPVKDIAGALRVSSSSVSKDIDELLRREWLKRDNENNLVLDETEGVFLKNTASAEYLLITEQLMDQNTKKVHGSEVEKACKDRLGFSEQQIEKCHKECLDGGYLADEPDTSIFVNLRIVNEERHYLEYLSKASPPLIEYPRKRLIKNKNEQ